MSVTQCLCAILIGLNTCYRAPTRSETLQCCVNKCLRVILGDITRSYY